MANLSISHRLLVAAVAALVLAASGLRASESPANPEPELIAAVRGGDVALWRALLAHGADVSARDAQGNTALHLAAYYGDVEAVAALLNRGAKPDAQNNVGATALLYGAGNDDIVRILLSVGANPNLASKIEQTPLMAAAAHPQSHVTVARLLRAGANPAAKVHGQEYVAVKAVYGADPKTLEMVLKAGASPQQTKGDAPSPLAMAVYFGDRTTTDILLSHKADVNFDSDFAGHALNWAMYSGYTDLAALLIAKGSDLHFKSPWGHQTPPMVFAGYGQSGDPTVARLLVEKGANVNETNELGASALSLALKNGPHSQLVTYLLKAGAKAPPEPPYAKTLAARKMPEGTSVAERAQRAVNLLEKASDGFVDNRFVRDQAKCVSCHHETLPAVAFAAAAARGLKVDAVSVGHLLTAQMAMYAPRAEAAREMEDPIADSPVQIGYGLNCLKAVGYAPDAMTEALTRYLVNGQSPDGSWHWTDLRPPLEGGRFTATAWAVRAIQLYPPDRDGEAVRDCFDRARKWFRKAAPGTFGDQTAQLMGLAWAGESPRRLRDLAASLLAAQRLDGGWAQLKDLDSDAWATGEALFALRESGQVPSSDPAVARAVAFLLKTQYEDGSWWVKSRTWPFQPHFDSGFPHGNDQWISAGATAWATLALLDTLPKDPGARPLPGFAGLLAAYADSAAAQRKAAAQAAASAAGKPPVDFAKDVYPVLERSCIKCHSGEKPKARLALTSRESLLKGGQSGEPAVLPGQGGESQLVVFASDEIEDLEMPPLNHRDKFPSLTPEEIARIRTWIDQGAAWNRPAPGPLTSN